jgi:hypothetical protein
LRSFQLTILFGIFAFFLFGCTKVYNQRLSSVKKELHTGNYPSAVKKLEETLLSTEEKNRLLYHLEAGLLYHLAGKYKQSNSFLESAEWISDELYTKSLSKQAASLMTSDNILPFQGEFYDYLFINYYKLLNYLYLGSLEDVMVEVRRINHKLSLFDKDDAFMHYLTALLYQYNRQKADAFIEYKKAYESYKNVYSKNYEVPFPRHLKRDIAVFYQNTRFSRCREFPREVLKTDKVPPKYGSVVFIVEAGFVPYKYEVRTEAVIPPKYKKKHPEKLKDIYYLKLAVPEYALPQESVKQVVLNLNEKSSDMDLVEDLGTVAVKTFEQEHSGLMAKTIARAVAKYLTYKTVKGKDDKENENKLRKVLGTTVNIFGAATEQADTRSWLTLPDRIFLAHNYLKPGKHEFSTVLKTAKGKEVSSDKKTFYLKEGELKFIVLRRFY